MLIFTSRQKVSNQTQMSFWLMLPVQGAWYTCFTAVTVMADTAGLAKANGTLIHCWQAETGTDTVTYTKLQAYGKCNF